ncbi:MAG: DsbA family protein [Gammaproteobacteria bacterium]|nr:DsbA family protein [Gammaproteobacteria bacterium]
MKKIIQLSLLSLCVGFGLSNIAIAADTKAPAQFTPAQVVQLHQVIHDYLVNDPQVLVEASQALQAQQEKKMEAGAMTAISANKSALFDDALSPTLGNKTAPATVVEFFDYQCGHCREMAPQIEKLISQDKNLHVVFKELPIFGGMSALAAKAALAANMQPGKYYAFHDALFASQGPLTEASIMAIAQTTGLNVVTLKKDMNSPEVSKEIRANFQLAQELKVMGTPTFVISNAAHTKFAYIPGATTLEDLQAKIKSVQ